MSNLDTIYTEVEKFTHETPTALTLLPLVVNIMEFVEKYKGLSGDEKKSLVIRFVHDKSPELASEELLGSFVDIVVAASKGLTKLNLKSTRGFFKKLFPCCKPKQ
jgi:hypothetical protein